jgi:GxxExxY protein
MQSRVRPVLPPDVEHVMHRAIGCALEVHKALGPGYLEPVYHKAMRIELGHQGLQFKSEHVVHIRYRNQLLHGHRIDLIVEGAVIVELKAVARFDPIHTSQLVSYLRATQLRAGLLVNFNAEWLRGNIRRVVV